MKRFAFVFARGGSKGVPGKNIKLLGGKPLLAYSIECARKSGLFERIVVSTDSKEIKKVACDYGAEVPFMRPSELARDDSNEWHAWQYTIKQLGGEKAFDLFVSIPTTAPLRSVDDVKSCVELYQQGDCDVVLTCKRAVSKPSLTMINHDENGFAHVAFPSNKSVFRRQDTPQYYDITSVAYVMSPKYILNNCGLLSGRVKTVIIPDDRGLDIDEPIDFEFAEYLMSRRRKFHEE